jgi:hypothetical protein
MSATHDGSNVIKLPSAGRLPEPYEALREFADGSLRDRLRAMSTAEAFEWAGADPYRLATLALARGNTWLWVQLCAARYVPYVEAIEQAARVALTEVFAPSATSGDRT